MDNPYFDVLYDYCCIVIENIELNGEYPFDIYLYLKDKIPYHEYIMLCEYLCKQLQYRHDDLICTISDIGIKIDIEDNDDDGSKGFNIKDDEVELVSIIINARTYNQDKNLYIMDKYNFIFYNNVNECYIIGKEVIKGEIVPLDADDLIIANKIPMEVKYFYTS